MYKKIMVPLDGSEIAECVIPHMEAIASGCNVFEVVFVRVVDHSLLPVSVPARGDFGFTEKDRQRMETNRIQKAEEYLKQIVGGLSIPRAVLSFEVLTGKAADTLADYATANNVDLIVIASHGRSGVSRWVLGSVADRIVRNSCIPVMIVRAPGCEPK